MPKTLGDMAKFLKILIPMDIPETYTFNLLIMQKHFSNVQKKSVLVAKKTFFTT